MPCMCQGLALSPCSEDITLRTATNVIWFPSKAIEACTVLCAFF